MDSLLAHLPTERKKGGRLKNAEILRHGLLNWMFDGQRCRTYIWDTPQCKGNYASILGADYTRQLQVDCSSQGVEMKLVQDLMKSHLDKIRSVLTMCVSRYELLARIWDTHRRIHRYGTYYTADYVCHITAMCNVVAVF